MHLIQTKKLNSQERLMMRWTSVEEDRVKGNKLSKACEWECKSQVEVVNKLLSEQNIDTKIAIYSLGRTLRVERDHESTHKNLQLKISFSNEMCTDKEQTETEEKPKQLLSKLETNPMWQSQPLRIMVTLCDTYIQETIITVSWADSHSFSTIWICRHHCIQCQTRGHEP